MANSERVVLVDGSNLMYRAFFALPGSLMTSGGVKTNAAFGFATMFRKLFAGKTPAIGAIVFDAPGGTFRDEKYPEYKATRPRMPDDLRRQVPLIHELTRRHGFPLLQIPRVEADDVIGTLAREASDAGHDVIIVSSDKDFGQLVSDRVKMLDTLRDITFDAELVRKKWGVPPEQIIDYLAILGDKVDNVPGIAGVGQKGAVQLLEAYGSLDGVYAHLDELKGKKRENIEAARDIAYLSKELVTIDQHVPLGLTLDDLAVAPPDPADLNKLFVELEFFSLIGDEGRDALSESDSPTHYQRVTSVAALDTLLEDLGRDAPVAVTPVFTRPIPAITPLAGIALASKPGRAWYVPFAGEGAVLGAAGLARLGDWLADPARQKVAHDMKVLWRALRRQSRALAGVTFDTRLASYLINPTKIIPHRLDQLSREYLQRTIRPAKSVTGSGKKEVPFIEADADALTEWACHRADAIISMAPTLIERLDAEGHTQQLLDHDLPLSEILGQMEVDGILVDTEDLARMEVEFKARLSGYEAQIHGLAGRTFNIASTKQLATVLFEDLGLPVIKRTKTGYSTNAEVLEKLAAQGHEIASVLLDQRKLAKLINTYTDVLQRSVFPGTGRIHTTFQQTTAATGRLITTDPDLQRTPVHTPEGRRIRQAFVAPEGFKLISADWSQIELRLLAHVSGDPGLVEAFTEGRDVHRRTAGKLFGVPPDDVTRDQRDVGKTVNFATIYGQGATALGQLLKISRKKAKAYIDRYFETYAGVRTWLDTTIAEALESGFAMTMAGRRRYIPELTSASPMERQAGMRIAANTPIQGSAADLCKDAMMQIPPRFAAAGLRTRMLLQIHDELLFEAPDDEIETASLIVRDVMEHAASLRVPLVVDVGVGRSWADAH